MSARGTWNTAQGIRNSSYYLNLESSTWNPEPMAWNPEFKTVFFSWRFCLSNTQISSEGSREVGAKGVPKCDVIKN